MNLLKSYRKNNKGLSLVELIVTIAIMSIISVGIAAAVVSSTKSYTTGSSEVDLQQEVQNITNILNNLVMDANEAKNAGVGGTATGSESLFIESSNGDYYVIAAEEVDGAKHLKFYELNDDYSVAEGYTLSTYVDTFEAKPGKKDGEWDYTVDFNLIFKSKVVGTKAPDREFKTSFLAMSRNGKTVKTDSEKDKAIIIADSEAVIEPNQGRTDIVGVDAYEIPFEILISGNQEGVTYSITSDDTEDGPGTGNYKDSNGNLVYNLSYTTDLNAESKVIRIKAYETLTDDFNITITVNKPGTTGYPVSHPIKVYVRRVAEITDLQWHDNVTHSGINFKTNAQYLMKPEIKVANEDRNAERFFHLSIDDDYIDPTVIKVKLTETVKYSPNYLSVTVYKSDGSIADSFSGSSITEDGFKLLQDQYFIVKLERDMEKGARIVFDAYAPHASKTDGTTGEAIGTAENKSTVNYSYIHKKYTIKRVESLFPASSGFKRGADNDKPSFYDQYPSSYQMLHIYAEDFYLPYLQEKYKDDTTAYVAPGGTITTRKNYFCNMLDVDKLVGMLNGKISFSAFYSVGSTEIPDNPAQNSNYYRNEGGYYWSQYRIMSGKGGANAYHLTKPNDGDGADVVTGGDSDSPGALRLDPDKEYSLEFLSVLYNEGEKITLFHGLETIESKSILWPQYDKMMDLGFGTEHNGAGYIFDGNAEQAKDDLTVFFAEVYPVTPALITYRPNEGILQSDSHTISSVDKSIGSDSDPIILGGGLSESFVFFNQLDWDGLATNAYMNRANGIFQYNNGGGWVTIANDLSTDVQISIAGIQMKVIGSEGKIKFQNGSENGLDFYSVFRYIPTIKQYKYYIKDSEGIFSRTVYGDSNGGNKYTFSYPNDSGYIYFRKYGAPVNITFNANGGSLYSDSAVESQTILYVPGYGGNVIPTAYMDGKQFDGWYTDPNSGNKITETVLQSVQYIPTDLYAHWKDPDPYTYTFTRTGGWDKHVQYNVRFINNTGTKIESIEVSIPYYGNVTGVEGSANSYSIENGVIKLTFNNWNNGINANSSTGDVNIVLVGTDAFGFSE